MNPHENVNLFIRDDRTREALKDAFFNDFTVNKMAKMGASHEDVIIQLVKEKEILTKTLTDQVLRNPNCHLVLPPQS